MRLPLDTGVVARKIGQPLSANSNSIFSAIRSQIPCGLFSSITTHGFRPTVMLPTFYPLYLKTLQQLAGGAVQSRRGPQCGHAPGRQAHEVVWMLRRVGWIATWLRRLITSHTTESSMKLDDIVSPGIRRTRSVPQGDPCAADLFGAALDTPAAKFCDMCQYKKWELPVGSSYLGLLPFADNCWIIAMSPRELQTVARAWKELLKASGLQIDWGEAVWCSTAQDSLAASITVSDRLITRRAREKDFKAFGVWITFDSHFTKELAEREVAAWRQFYANRQMLCDNKLALKYRLRLLTSCVVSSMYWCVGSWILTSTQCTHLRAKQDRMLRKMIYVPRRPDESAESHMTRWARLLRNCRATYKFLHRQILLVVCAHCKNHDERSDEGNKQIVFA